MCSVFYPYLSIGFYGIGQYSHKFASLWLAAASLFFYGWWDVRFIGLLLGSIAFNFGAGYWIGHSATNKKTVLIAALVVNLLLLGYFKYVNFFIASINQLFSSSFPISEIFLPLGISFFTFTQIAFLVDTFQGKVKEYNFGHYVLFVTYFPHLIAGPVLHHKEMMPQFARPATARIDWANIALGFSVFALGLAKKVLIADSVALYATPIFKALAAGGQPLFCEAWIGALAYTFQLYFDFSAYSDMAIGLSLMFNVKLPINFNSPYKATSIIDFWRRWHITLSRFLREYLYFPLGGNRKGETRRYINLMVTMLLGGLWHGAGWTFIVWGGLHGFYLMINHLWRHIKQSMQWGDGGIGSKLASQCLTFLAVVVGWVFFRADSVDSAMMMLKGMAGLNGISFKNPHTMVENVNLMREMTAIGSGMLIAFTFPNIQQIVMGNSSGFDHGETTTDVQSKPLIQWQPTLGWAMIIGCLFFISFLSLNAPSEFLYFQF